MRRSMALVLVWGGLWACDDEEAAVVDAVVVDQAVDQRLQPDVNVPEDAAPADLWVPPVDMAPPPDMRPPPPDMGPPPDLGPLDGPPCDPRLRAVACEDPGQFCVHIPGAREDMGRCQQGDGCKVGVDPNGCPPDRPYCHLKGAATICTTAGELRAGDDCVDEWGLPQPCQDGLVCNFSVCQAACDPAAPDPGCPDDGRCANITATIGAEGGLCGPRNCNWFTGAGCAAGQKCSFTIRNDGVLVGSCTMLDGPGNRDGALCQNLATGGDNCAQGLYCTGPLGRERICRTLCDTGGYEAPCPDRQACEERLSLMVDSRVRGFGLCVTNQ
ncbi:MAG: hypothetical protein KC620_07720 [Myxococcales bacterium]|nr:hypothetical protein [Myxococcales bacterium]